MARVSKYAQLQSLMVERMMLLIGRAPVVTESTWYADWGALLGAVAQEYSLSPEHGAAIFAALSPRKNIARNWAMFLECLAVGPEQCREATKRTRGKVRAMLQTAEPLGLLSPRTAPKTHAFARNLLGDLSIVTIDTIMAQCCLDDESVSGVPNTLYRAASAAVIQVAGMLHWQPANVQATVWSLYREAKPTHKGRGFQDPDAKALYTLLVA